MTETGHPDPESTVGGPRDWLTDEEEAHVRRSLAISRDSDWSDAMMRRAIGSLDRARSLSQSSDEGLTAAVPAPLRPDEVRRESRDLTAEEAVEKALLHTFQLSNKDYRKMQTAMSEVAFIRALEQDGYTVRPIPDTAPSPDAVTVAEDSWFNVRSIEGGVYGPFTVNRDPDTRQIVWMSADGYGSTTWAAIPDTAPSPVPTYVAEEGAGGWHVRRHDGIVYAGATEDEARRWADKLNANRTAPSPVLDEGLREARHVADLAFEVHKPDAVNGTCEHDGLKWPCDTASLSMLVIEALAAPSSVSEKPCDCGHGSPHYARPYRLAAPSPVSDGTEAGKASDPSIEAEAWEAIKEGRTPW